jgi:hypothetical protein
MSMMPFVKLSVSYVHHETLNELLLLKRADVSRQLLKRWTIFQRWRCLGLFSSPIVTDCEGSHWILGGVTSGVNLGHRHRPGLPATDFLEQLLDSLLCNLLLRFLWNRVKDY